VDGCCARIELDAVDELRMQDRWPEEGVIEHRDIDAVDEETDVCRWRPADEERR
jgi:hypothetical protein